MPATDNRVMPLAEVRVYDVGQGDRIITDRGHRWHDVLLQTGKDGTYSSTAGIYDLELLPEVGLVCRGNLVVQDTRSSQYTYGGGIWTEFRPSSGAPGYRLCQWDTTKDMSAWAQSIFSLPANPSVVISLAHADSPSDADTRNYAPSAQARFGGDAWIVEQGQSGLRLLRWNSATSCYDDCGRIPQSPNGARDSEVWIAFRCHRGKVLVSADGGYEYLTVANEDGSAITVAAAPVRFATVNLQGMFGLHQVLYRDGTYTSPKHRTYKKRSGGASFTTGGQNNSGSIVITNVTVSSIDEDQYYAALSPGYSTSGGMPWATYFSPVLWSVTAKHNVQTSAGSGAYTTPWADAIEEIAIHKPEQLDQGTATITLWLETAAGFFAESWRYRKVLIRLGHLLEGGSNTLATRFTGYVAQVRILQETKFGVRVAIECENAACPARHQEWEYEAPFGGQSANAAIQDVLSTISTNIAFAGCSEGDAYTLPAGSGEEPSFRGELSSPKWHVLEKIVNHAGLEVGVRDDGTWYTVPKDYIDASVSQTWQAVPAASADESMRGAVYEMDARESATAIIAIGQDAAGRDIRAHVYTTKETDASKDDYSPWALPHVIRVTEPTTQAALSDLVLSEYTQRVPLRFNAEVTCRVLETLYRRNKVQVAGLIAGTDDAAEYSVRTLEHIFRNDPSGAELSTQATLRKVV